MTTSHSAGQSPLTRATRAGLESDAMFGAVVPPIYLSTNYAFTGLGQPRRHDYSRAGNPTRDILAEVLSDLEGGAGAVVTGSGMAAVTVTAHAMVRNGGRVALAHDCYGGTWRLFNALADRGQIDLALVDLTSPAGLASIADLAPELVWVETPSNPLLRITDLRAVSAAAHAAGARVVVDNTFLSPALQRPIEHGVDAVIHSTTKYLNGHSDVIGGAAIAAAADLAEEFCWWGNTLGVTGSAFDSYLTLRGLRTLGPRMRAHQENAAALAALLVEHAAVSRVFYPGLAEHAGHDLAARQQDGFGAMLSFELVNPDAVSALLTGLRFFSLAESLGGVESLICHPASMTHAAMPPDIQAGAGLTAGLLRVSAGIEATSDLVADLRAGLDRALAA